MKGIIRSHRPESEMSMEIRLLNSFLVIAEEGSITAAAVRLHITQPALSRQLVQLESELGCTLFVRGKRHMELTENGILLVRRAKEILDLVSLTENEIASQGVAMEGTISIGTGELTSMRTLASLIAGFREDHPNVKFNLMTGVADQVTERIDSGLLDMGLFLEPLSKDSYDYLRMPEPETWVVGVRADDPLACKSSITVSDLNGRSLILPNRLGVQSEIAHWFKKGKKPLECDITINLGGMGAALIEEGLGVFICVSGATLFWDPARVIAKPFNPSMESQCVLAWKRDAAQAPALAAFVDYAREELAERVLD